MKRAALFAVIFALLASPASGQAGTERFAFLKVPQGAKAVSMGGAFTAVADDPSAMNWNPAGTAQITSDEIYSSYTNWLLGSSMAHLASVKALPPHSIGVSVVSLNYGGINETTADHPAGTGSVFSPTDTLLTMNYAVNFNNGLLAGLNFNFISQNLGVSNSSWQSIDFGALYRVGMIQGLSVGAAYKHFSQLYKLPGGARIGLAYKQDVEEMGSGKSKAMVSADLDITDSRSPLLCLGTEYNYMGRFLFRGGLNTRSESGAGGNYSLGLGLIYQRFVIDLAYVPYDKLGNTYRIALDYRL